MASDVLVMFCGVYSVIVFTFLVLVSGVGNNVDQSISFTEQTCDGSFVCLESKPARSLRVRSKIECGLECQRQTQQSVVCIGVNYRQYQSTCDIFYSDQGITNASNFTKSDAGCRYIQRNAVPSINCFAIFPKCAVKAMSIGGYADTSLVGGVLLKNNVVLQTLWAAVVFRGFNIIELNVSNCSVSSYRHFDTSVASSEATAMATYISGLPTRTVLVGVTTDEARNGFNAEAINALLAIGVSVNGLAYQSKVSFIAQVGRPSIALTKMTTTPPNDVLTLTADVRYQTSISEVTITFIN